ncbi:hypothetical protein SLA2020_159990 [Shorea laevis]
MGEQKWPKPLCFVDWHLGVVPYTCNPFLLSISNPVKIDNEFFVCLRNRKQDESLLLCRKKYSLQSGGGDGNAPVSDGCGENLGDPFS